MSTDLRTAKSSVVLLGKPLLPQPPISSEARDANLMHYAPSENPENLLELACSKHLLICNFSFLTTFVNPIGIDSVSWRYLISYCCWLGFEVVFVFFMFPETANKTLEELTFIFESKELADRATAAVEKVVHHEDMPGTEKPMATSVEKAA
jgi:hypothetical protein